MDVKIEFVGDLHRLDVRPGDKYVITCAHRLDAETCERIKEAAARFLGARSQVMVLDCGLRLGVVREVDG